MYSAPLAGGRNSPCAGGGRTRGPGSSAQEPCLPFPSLPCPDACVRMPRRVPRPHEFYYFIPTVNPEGAAGLLAPPRKTRQAGRHACMPVNQPGPLMIQYIRTASHHASAWGGTPP